MLFSINKFAANIYTFITHGLAQASHIYTLLTYGLPPPGSTFSIWYQYYVHQSFQYTNPIFSYMVLNTNIKFKLI